MKQIYNAPDFELTEFEVEDIITVSVGTGTDPIDDGGWIDI